MLDSTNDGWIVVKGARGNNLQGIDAAIPVGLFTCACSRLVGVTGVSGSGPDSREFGLRPQKVHANPSRRALPGDPDPSGTPCIPGCSRSQTPTIGELYGTRTIWAPHSSLEGTEQFDKVIDIDQSPIGRTPRSNPATYTGTFDMIRELFAMTPDTKIRGYKNGRFSPDFIGRWAVRGVQGRRHHQDRDALPARRVCAVRGVQRQALQPGEADRRFESYRLTERMEVNLPEFAGKGYKTYEWRHAAAILKEDFPEQWGDLIAVLSDFKLRKSHIQKGGGEKSLISKSLEKGFKDRGWAPKNWDTKIEIAETKRGKPVGEPVKKESPTHEVDHVKGEVALEIEWSNKDPFYDRDLNNFRLLFELRVISVGVIITKSDDLINLFKSLPDLDKDGKQKQDKKGRGVSCMTKFGMSTTWFSKLRPRIEGGGGGGCPILVFAITNDLYDEHT